jgi:hypothetical protein
VGRAGGCVDAGGLGGGWWVLGGERGRREKGAAGALTAEWLV